MQSTENFEHYSLMTWMLMTVREAKEANNRKIYFLK